jgi:Ca-activated chloride channel homolog
MPLFCFRTLVAFCLATALLNGQAQQKKGSAAAQRQTAAEPSDDRIILDVTRVNILFAVTDKKGRFVTNLNRDDFEVFETKKQQNILEFTAETNLPLRLGILIDTSNSIRDRFRFIQDAATEFLKSVMRPEVDRTVLVSFDTSAQMISDLTNDIDKLEKGIKDLRPGGGTALYDAIFFSCRDKLIIDQPRHKFRRALVILSDGDDNQSRYTREQALEMAQKTDVVIYTISTNRSGTETEGDRLLKYLARETGGMAFFPFKVQDMQQSFTNIANELRSQYNLFYRPEPLRADGLYHTVDVRVKNKKDLQVRARRGYYAPNALSGGSEED